MRRRTLIAALGLASLLGVASCDPVATTNAANSLNGAALQHHMRREEAEAGASNFTVNQGPQSPAYSNPPRPVRDVKWERVAILGQDYMGWRNCQGLLIVPYGDPLAPDAKYSVRDGEKWLDFKHLRRPDGNREDLFNYMVIFGK